MTLIASSEKHFVDILSIDRISHPNLGSLGVDHLAFFKKRMQNGDSVADGDAQVLAALVANGAVLTNARRIRHYLYSKDEGAARTAAESLAASGYTVEVKPSATGGNWLLLSERDETVNAGSVMRQRARFEELARNMAGGEYDGWEASLPERG